MEKRMVPYTISMTPALVERIDEAAPGRTRSAFVRAAIQRALRERERRRQRRAEASAADGVPEQPEAA